ncbi:MAG: Kinesin light chain [Deltaproteobacteria bacterium]|nr:Kinesin light chain [Deltaproteobacteria bacterium]
MKKINTEKPFRFAIALSFPCEIRDYIEQVDEALSQWCAPEKVFYDDRFLPEITGFEADTFLQTFYHDQSELIVVFLSREYEQKKWCCNVEWRAVQGLINKRNLGNRNSILLLRFDKPEIPGVIDSVPNISTVTPQQTAEIIWQRLQILRRKSPTSLTLRAERQTDFVRPENIPYPRNPCFTGRDEVLTRLHDNLVLSHQPQVISGFGGIGKTQIAAEYAYRYQAGYTALFWARADTIQSLMSDFIALARLLNLPEADLADESLAVAAVGNWLETHEDWLLIVDNADNPDLVADFLPPNGPGHLVITSRAQVFDALGISEPVVLLKMEPEEAKLFLLTRTGRKQVSKEEDEALSALAGRLEYLPLALDEAAAFIVGTKSGFEGYLARYETLDLLLFEKRERVVGQYPQSFAAACALNFDEVDRSFPAAADFLRVAAFLYPEKIPFELFTSGAPELGPHLSEAFAANDPILLDEVVETPARYSLIHKVITGHTYAVHPFVQAMVRETMDTDTERLWAERVVKAMARAFPHRVEFSTWPLCERLLPHARTCVDLVIGWGFESEEVVRFLNRVGYYMDERARYAEAEPLFQHSLTIREKTLGPDHPDVAISLNNLAELYRQQGRYAEAEPLFQRSLAIWEKALGPFHPDVAISLNNLAGLYYQMGRYAEAEPLFQRSAAIWENALGPDHPEVAESLGNLAELYRQQGRYAEAEPLFQRSLAIWEKAQT